MPADYDALSDGSELTGEDSASDHHREEDDDEVMASAPRTPSKKRRRIVRAVEDDDEDEDEVADALEDDADQLDDEEEEEDEVEDDNDELDEDDEDYDAPSTSRARPSRTSGRQSASSSRGSGTPKRASRTSTRTAAIETPPASTGAKKSLRVKLTRTPNAASAPAHEASPAPSSRPTRAAAVAPASRRVKDSTKVKWKPRGKGKDSDVDDDSIRTPDEDELDDEEPDISRAVTADPDDSGSDSASEPDEATAAEMQAIIGKTARQLAREGGVESEHLELPMFDPNRKKKLTENEIALRRSETARKRKNQVEKKLEDDKVETINRLLKKQVGRSRNKLPRTGSAEDSDDEAEQARRRGREELSRKALKEMPAPFFRYIDRADGKILAVPSGPPLVEEVWGPNYVQVNQALIEEVDVDSSAMATSAKARELEEKAKQRFKQQRERWDDDQTLERVWGQEGLYEYKLRAALGQTRREWIGNRRAPTPENDAQSEDKDDERNDDEADQDADVADEDMDASEQPDDPESK